MREEINNRLEELFEKLLDNGDATELEKEWDHLNRLEQYLVCIINKSDIARLGEPMNRLERLLQAVYINKK